MVTKTREKVRVRGMTYKAVVQKVILYLRKKCVVTVNMLKLL